MKPVLQALVLADRVYQDVTGKKIIAGTFNCFLFSRRPASREVELEDGTKQTHVQGGLHAGSPYAYISLTDVCKGTTLRLQFVDLTKNKQLFGTDVTVDCNDRLRTIELVLPLPPLPIESPGTYAFEVVWEHEILGSYRITAKEIQD